MPNLRQSLKPDELVLKSYKHCQSALEETTRRDNTVQKSTATCQTQFHDRIPPERYKHAGAPQLRN